MANRKFDLGKVSACFAKSKKDGDVVMDDYIEGYTELSKMFGLLGTVFSFVSNDVTDKLHILQYHRESGAGPNYITVQSMVNYEVDNKLTRVYIDDKTHNGSRTLLRLHRALEFIVSFLKALERMGKDEKLSTAAGDAYNQTLSKYHPWLVRKGVGLALYTLPTRKQLLERMQCESEEKTLEHVESLIVELQIIYDNVQRIYEENSIVSLP